MTPQRTGSWAVVVPVKSLDAAKSRLRSGSCGDGPSVAALALAFACDAVAAALTVPEVREVVVVTSDPAVRSHLGEPRVRFVHDPGAGLNAAITAGIAASSGATAVMLGDLPALRGPELDAALRSASEQRLALVADAAGSGTTMITATDARELHPSFGEGSAARHRAAGHVDLALDAASSLRRDVDTDHDLELALALGVGPATAAALGRARPRVTPVE